MATERIDVVVTETGTREVSRRIEDVGRAASRASGPLLAMQRLLASYISFEGIRRLMQLADQYTEMENRIRVLDGTTQHYSVTLRRLYNISQETRSSLRDNVLLFQRMGLAQRELGATTEELFQVTRAVGQAIAIQGGLATTSAGAVLQLSQAFGSGRVQLEEFNSVITGLYPIAKAAADGIDATGGSIARLRRMIADGEVDSRMLFQGILNSLDSLDEQFKQTTPTISQAFTMLRNSLVMYVGDLNSASGASESFARAIITLSKNMDEVVKGAVVLGAALGPAALTRVVLGLRAAFIALNAAMLANPIGAMVTAISALIAYYLVFNKELEKTANKIDENSTAVDRMGATWAGVLAYIKKAWENFPQWFGDLIYRALDEAVKALANFGTTMAQGLMPDIKAAAKIMQFFGRENVHVDEAGITKWFEDLFNFELPPGVKDRMGQNGSDAAQAFDDAYEDYLLRARYRRETLGEGEGGGGGGLPPGAPNKKALKDLQKELDRVLDAIDPVDAAWRKFFESVDTLDKGLAAGILTLEEYEGALGKLKATMLDDVFPFEAIMRDLLTQRVLLSKEVSERERLARIYEVEKTLKRALTQEELQLLDARLQMLQVAEREAQLMDEIQQPTLDYSRNIQALNNLYRDGVISVDEFNQKLQELRYQFLQTQTDFVSGVERGLLAIEQEFTDTASLVEQAMVRAFGNMEDALTQFLRTGKMDVKSFVNDVLNDLARLYVRQNITSPLAQSLGLMGGSSQEVGGGGFSFGGGPTFGAGAVEKAGDWLLRSGLAPETGAKMLMNADAIASTANSIFGYGKAVFDLAEGRYGSAAGTAIGTYIMPGPGTVVGNFVGGIIDSFFDREPTTRREQRTQVEYAGGVLDITKRDDRVQAGADVAVAQMTAAAIDSANSLFQSIGVDAAIESFRSIMASSYKRDRDGVASGGTLRIGDRLIDFGITDDTNPTLGGFGGWSSVDPMQRIGTEIQLSMLEAFQAVSDELPSALANMLADVDIRSLGEQEAQALAERFTMLTQGASAFLAAVEQMPFAELRDLSFDAAAGLVQFAGGLDNLLTAQQTYYERFYSDAERHAHAVDQLTQALAGVGVEMPSLVGSTGDMLASYRALVESLDLNTEAGQQAYVVLMQSAGAFADVAEFAGQAAGALRSAADIAREREGLERQLLQLQGNTIELRRRELEALDESNRALQLRIWALQDQKLAEQEAARRASAERRDVLAARRAAEEREREAFEAAMQAYEDGAKAFDELRQSLLSAGDAAGLLAATIERALSNPTGKYMAGGVEYDVPRWNAGTTAAGFNYEWAVMQMRLARDLSDEISANALRIENAGAALTALAPNIGEYSPVVGPMAQALTNAVVEASDDIGYAVRDSVYQAMLVAAQQDVYSQFASRGAGLAGIRYAQQQALWASQAGWVPGMGMQFGADVVAYGNALDKLAGRMQSGQITTEQYEAAVEALNRTMPTAAELLGDTEAQLQRMADAAHDVAMAGARSIDHYFGELRKMAQELEKTEEPINKVTAAIGRMNSWVSAFGESAQAAGEYSKRTPEAALIAQAAGIAASVLTTADARAAAEKLSQDEAFAGVGGAELRDMSLLVDGIRAFDPDSWERAFIRISDALGQGVIDEDQFAALFNYSLDVFEDTERATEQLRASFDQLRKAAGSLADELLLDRNLTTLSFGQQYTEAQRQYQEVMRRAMGGDVDAAYDLDRVTRNFLERSADSRDEIQYRRDFARSVNSLRQIEASNPMKEMATEIKRLNQEVEGLRDDLREANATVASNTNDTTRELRRINATGIKVQA